MMANSTMQRLAANAMRRLVDDVKAPGVAEQMASKASKAKNQPKSPAEVHKMVHDHGALETVAAWTEFLLKVTEVPSKPEWTESHWSKAVDWVEELEVRREELERLAEAEAAAAAEQQGAEVHQISEAAA